MKPRPNTEYDVAFYVPWIGPRLVEKDGLSTGGAETQVFLLARALADRGFSVCLIAFEVPGVELPRSIEGVDVHVRPAYKSRQRLTGKLREAASIRAALRAVPARTIVTRAAGPHIGLTAVFAKLLRRRFVYSSASPIDFDLRRVASTTRDRVLLWIGYRLADAIVVQSQEQVESCRTHVGREPVLIRSIAEHAEAGASREAFLWVGRLVGYKQPLEFVELARAVPEATFWMVAAPVPFAPDGPRLADAVARAAEELPNLNVIDPMPRPRLLELVGRATAVVSTSEFEGMPNVFLEGWARGIPAVAYSYDPDGVVERERLGEFAAGSSETLAEIARHLWHMRFDLGPVSSRCRSFVQERHSAEAVADRWSRVLDLRSVPLIADHAYGTS